jgi:hypothetical protein
MAASSVTVRKKLRQTGRCRHPEFAIGRLEELENPRYRQSIFD